MHNYRIILILVIFNIISLRLVALQHSYNSADGVNIVEFPTLNPERRLEEESVLLGGMINNESITNDFISGLLSNGKPIKLTADPNESIDLFSGMMNLAYKDISVQVVPGLNMEYLRSYRSAIYDKFPFQNKRHWQYNMAQNGWHMHSGYISLLKSCKDDSNLCQPVYVDAKGMVQSLLPYDNDAHQLRSVQHYQFTKNAAGYLMVAPNGFRYYFTHYYELKNSYRYYLTRVETPDAHHYVQYHYDDILLTKITSSDPSKIISVEFKTFEIKLDKEKQYITQPVAIYFNDQLMAQYNYVFTRFAHHQNYTLVPVAVKLANGQHWHYSYGYMDLRIKHHKHGEETNRLLLTEIIHPDDEKTQYLYNIDFNLNYAGQLHGVYLAHRQHFGNNKIADGAWSFTTNSGPSLDGSVTKLVRINGPYNITDYIFHDYHNQNLWRAGLPAVIKIYDNFDVNSILQQEKYSWQNVTHSYQQYKASVVKNGDVFDESTKRPILTSKTIWRGQSVFANSYSNFDSYDNPQKILQSNGKTSREIKQDILNIVDKNILGLKTVISVNDNPIVYNDYDDYGRLISVEYLGVKKKFQYNKGLLSSTQDMLDNIVYYSEYQSGLPGIIRYPDGTAEQQTISPYGKITKYVNQNNVTTELDYDSYGRLIKYALPEGEPTIYHYDKLDQYVKQGSNINVEHHNAYGLIVDKIENNRYQTVIKYDALGRKIFHSYRSDVADSLSGHYYKYDSLGRVIKDCSPTDMDSSCVTYNYLENNSVETLYPNGNSKLILMLGYGDPDNSKISVIKQGERKTVITRDELDYVTSVQQAEILKTYSYDKNHRLIKYSEPETGVTEYKYDLQGNIIQKIINGYPIEYKYDQKNFRLLKTIYSDISSDESYQYDKKGNLISANKGIVTNKYVYNANDNLIVQHIKINDKEFSLKYNYNNLQHLDSVIYPDGALIKYNPNEFGQPTTLGPYLSNIKYHPNKQWSEYNYGHALNASTKLDSLNRISNFNYDTLSLNYNYDSSSNLQKLEIRDSKDAQYNYIANFQYDELDRISVMASNLATIDYEYDHNDNLIKLTHTTEASNQFLDKRILFTYYNGKLSKNINTNKNHTPNINIYNYDKQGNMTADSDHTYTYGLDANLLRSIGKEDFTFEYDIHQNRVTKKSDDSRIFIVYNYAGLPFYSYDYVSGESHKYLYLNNKRVAAITHYESDNHEKINYYYNDALGSPVAIADKNDQIIWRTIYSPFGKQLLQKTDDASDYRKYGFIGKEIDQNRLSYFGARYYNSELGQFTSADSVPVEPTNPFSFNRYIYANNNPYKYIDDDGRSAEDIFTSVAEAGLGFIIGAYTTYSEHHSLHKALLGGIAGSVAAVVASPALSESAASMAVQGWSIASQLLAGVSVETLMQMTVDNNAKLKNNTKNESETSVFRLVYEEFLNKKINPIVLNTK